MNENGTESITTNGRTNDLKSDPSITYIRRMATEKALAQQEVSRADALQVRIETEKARLGLEQVKDHHRVVWQQLATSV